MHHAAAIEIDLLIMNRPRLCPALHPGFLSLGLSGRGFLSRTSKLLAVPLVSSPCDKKKKAGDGRNESDKKGRIRPKQTKRMMGETNDERGRNRRDCGNVYATFHTSVRS